MEWEEQRAILTASMETFAWTMERMNQGRTSSDPEGMDRFMRQNPPIFRGTEGPEAAEDWIFSLEKIFEAIQTSMERRVVLATYVFRAEAEQWWRSTRPLHFSDVSQATWGQFLDLFFGKFFPIFARDQKKKEFLSLQQGSAGLEDYIFRFHRLERYCPGLYSTPRERAGKFVEGLKEGLRRLVIGSRPKTLEDTIDSAWELEVDYLRSNRSRDDRKRTHP
jgi:hypothetical protein